jgi:hypothetical protein
MAKELTVSALANIGCAAGLEIGRWNACTAWTIYEVDSDKERVFLRLHDRMQSLPLSRIILVAQSYDINAPADGTVKEFELPYAGLSMSAWDVKEWLIPQLLEIA